jgi:hypothetical protein
MGQQDGPATEKIKAARLGALDRTRFVAPVFWIDRRGGRALGSGMRGRTWFGMVWILGLILGFGTARAEGEAAGEHHDGATATEHQGEADPRSHHDQAAASDAADRDDDGDDDADGEAPYDQFDVDGDGKADHELKREYEEAFAGIPQTIDTGAVDQELDARPEDKQLLPSITIDQFRTAVRVARKVVLDRMEAKMANSAAKKLNRFARFVFLFSLAGVLLLAMPLVLARRYPGKRGILFKYSGLAALTFFVTVNLFGGVLVAMRATQAAMGSAANPSLAIAAGTFDTLDRNAEEYIDMGKELFVPTLEQMRGDRDEQPSVLLLENGQKIIKDAKVFVGIAKMVKKLDFLFQVLPIVLFGVTMILFGIAIRPTLAEIVKLPLRAAAGEAGIGREVTAKAMRRVWGELRATVCTIAVLVVLTLVSGFVLGRVVSPALDALLGYFSRAVTYLQFVDGASSGLVFLTLFGVILFLVLNVAMLIVSMSFFLGKSQKIFQAKFNDGLPVKTHARFFKLGVPAVLLVQLFPWLYALIADKVLLAIDHSVLDGVSDANQVSWTKLLLAGPAFLVVGFIVAFWAARGGKAIGFLFGYKVKPRIAPPAPPATEDTYAA